MKKTILLIISILLTYTLINAKVSDTLIFQKNTLTDIEKAFFNDIDDGVLDKFTLYDACIIASNISDKEEFYRYKKQLDKIRTKTLKAIKESKEKDPYVISKQLLFYLHDNVFKKYKRRKTLITDILDNGTFNCLSSSILYNLLAIDLGIDVYSVVVPNHVLCVLNDKRGNKDIETTIKYGFDPGKKEIVKIDKEIRTIFTNKKYYTNREKANLIDLISLLYANNLSLSKLKINTKKNYKENLIRFSKAYYINPKSSYFKESVIACYNNYIIALLKENNYKDAFTMIKRASKFAPNDKGIRSLFINYYNKYMLYLMDKNKYKEAVDIAKFGIKRFGDESIYHNLVLICDKYSQELFSKKDYKKVLELYKDCFAGVPEKFYNKNIKKGLYIKCTKLFSAKNFKEAIDLCEFTLKEIGRDPEYDKKIRDIIKKSKEAFAINLYNSATKAFNKKDFKKALEISNDGIKLYYDSKIRYKLEKLRDNINKNMGILIYNKAVKMYNKRKYKEAYDLCIEGMDKSSGKLKKELKRLKDTCKKML